MKINGLAPLLLLCALMLVALPASWANGSDIVSEDLMVPAAAPGIQLFMRHKYRKGTQATAGDRILLFVHGATYPSETTFDFPIEGVSMMDLFASNGYDTYLVDVRGYGRSTRIKEMDEPAANHPPLVHTADAAADLGAAVDYVLKAHRVDRINLMGWSWGTSIAGLYTSEHNATVNRLVLYAPMWYFRQETGVPGPKPSAGGTMPAYRLVTVESAKDRWLKGVAEDKKATLIPAGIFDA